MKQVVIAFVLIGLITALIVCNALYLTNLCGELLDMCIQLPETKEQFQKVSAEQVENILAKFKSNTIFMNLALPFPEIREAECAITDLISYVRAQNYEEYVAAKARSILRLKILQGYEIPTIEHLL